MPLESSPTIDVRSRQTRLRTLPRPLAESLALGLLALWLLGSGVLLCRRLAGGLENPLGWPPMLIAGGLVGVMAVATRVACLHASWCRLPKRGCLSVHAFVTVAAVTIGLSISLPGSPVAGVVLIWGVLVAEEFWAWKEILFQLRRQFAETSADSQRASEEMGTASAALCVEPGESRQREATIPIFLQAQHEEDSELPEDVLQRFTRNRTSDGSDVLSGLLRVVLTAGQRTASVHVAFCPPFSRIPQIAVEQCEGEPARIKVGQLLPYGARFDLKLGCPSESTEGLVLRFWAEARAPSAAEQGATDELHGS